MKPRKWNQAQLAEAVERSRSIREVLGRIGLVQAGGNYATVRRHMRKLGLSTAHFNGQPWNKGVRITSNPGQPLEKILAKGVYYESFKLKRRLFAAELKQRYCEECGWAQRTSDGYLPLELHHVNGDPADNRLENLLILCPNCHSMKPNYRARARRQSSQPRWRNGQTRDT